MKIKHISKIISIFCIVLLFGACKTNSLPKIQNPTYEFYNLGSEKGYKVKFKLKNGSNLPLALIINKVKQQILPEHKKGNEYNINVIAQSTTIFGFKPVIVDKEDGIFFKTDTAEVFQKVDFKLVDNKKKMETS